MSCFICEEDLDKKTLDKFKTKQTKGVLYCHLKCFYDKYLMRETNLLYEEWNIKCKFNCRKLTIIAGVVQLIKANTSRPLNFKGGI